MSDEMKVMRKGDRVNGFTVDSEGPIAESESCIVYSIVSKENKKFALKYIKRNKTNYFSILDKAEDFYLMRLEKLVLENRPEFKLYVTKYCDDNLEKRIKSMKDLRGVFLSSKILKDFGEMSVGLFVLHNNKTFHGNIKPGSVFVDDDVCKLGNFGTSEKLKTANEENNEDSRKYVAPEAFSNPSTIEENLCDIFSLGAVVYELIELVPLPRDDRFPFNPVQPCTFKSNSKIDLSVKQLILKMVSTSPQSRPTIDEVATHPVIREQIQSFPSVSLPSGLKSLYESYTNK